MAIDRQRAVIKTGINVCNEFRIKNNDAFEECVIKVTKAYKKSFNIK